MIPGLDVRISFPPEWMTPGWRFAEVVLTCQVDGAAAVVAGGVLNDESNLIGLSWHDGQRVARACPATGWAIEERFTGDAPTGAAQLWRLVIESMVNGLRQAREEEGW